MPKTNQHITVNNIFLEMKECDIIHGRKSDNVMLYTSLKQELVDEVNNLMTGDFDFCDISGIMHCFGMRVIWTQDISLNEVVCTYNGRTKQ